MCVWIIAKNCSQTEEKPCLKSELHSLSCLLIFNHKNKANPGGKQTLQKPKRKKLKTVFSDQSGLIHPALGVVLWGRNVIRNCTRMFPFRHDAK